MDKQNKKLSELYDIDFFINEFTNIDDKEFEEIRKSYVLEKDFLNDFFDDKPSEFYKNFSQKVLKDYATINNSNKGQTLLDLSRIEYIYLDDITEIDAILQNTNIEDKRKNVSDLFIRVYFVNSTIKTLIDNFYNRHNKDGIKIDTSKQIAPLQVITDFNIYILALSDELISAISKTLKPTNNDYNKIYDNYKKKFEYLDTLTLETYKLDLFIKGIKEYLKEFSAICKLRLKNDIRTDIDTSQFVNDKLKAPTIHNCYFDTQINFSNEIIKKMKETNKQYELATINKNEIAIAYVNGKELDLTKYNFNFIKNNTYLLDSIYENITSKIADMFKWQAKSVSEKEFYSKDKEIEKLLELKPLYYENGKYTGVKYNVLIDLEDTKIYNDKSRNSKNKKSMENTIDYLHKLEYLEITYTEKDKVKKETEDAHDYIIPFYKKFNNRYVALQISTYYLYKQIEHHFLNPNFTYIDTKQTQAITQKGKDKLINFYTMIKKQWVSEIYGKAGKLKQIRAKEIQKNTASKKFDFVKWYNYNEYTETQLKNDITPYKTYTTKQLLYYLEETNIINKESKHKKTSKENLETLKKKLDTLSNNGLITYIIDTITIVNDNGTTEKYNCLTEYIKKKEEMNPIFNSWNIKKAYDINIFIKIIVKDSEFLRYCKEKET